MSAVHSLFFFLEKNIFEKEQKEGTLLQDWHQRTALAAGDADFSDKRIEMKTISWKIPREELNTLMGHTISLWIEVDPLKARKAWILPRLSQGRRQTSHIFIPLKTGESKSPPLNLEPSVQWPGRRPSRLAVQKHKGSHNKANNATRLMGWSCEEIMQDYVKWGAHMLVVHTRCMLMRWLWLNAE